MSDINAFAGVFLIAAPPFQKSPTGGGSRVQMCVGREGLYRYCRMKEENKIMRRRV